MQRILVIGINYSNNLLLIQVDKAKIIKNHMKFLFLFWLQEHMRL